MENAKTPPQGWSKFLLSSMANIPKKSKFREKKNNNNKIKQFTFPNSKITIIPTSNWTTCLRLNLEIH